MKNFPNPASTLMVIGALSVAAATFMDRPVAVAVGWLMLLTGALGVVIWQAAREVSSAIRESQASVHLSGLRIYNTKEGDQ